MKIQKLWIPFLLVSIGVLATLFLTYASFTARIALYDYSFIVNIAHRISAGEIPYRDFDLPLTPGVFYVSFVVHEMFGWGAHSPLILSLFTAVLSLVLVLDIARKLDARLSILPNPTLPSVGILVAATFAGVNYIFAPPFYDNLATVALLISLNILLRAIRTDRLLTWFLAGASVLLPFVFKQNVGIFYILGVAVAYVVNAVHRRNGYVPRARRRQMITALFGFLGIIGLMGLALAISGAIPAFVSQVFLAAGDSKSVFSLGQLKPYATFTALGVLISGCAAVFTSRSNLRVTLLSWQWFLMAILAVYSIVQILTIAPTGYMSSFALPIDMLTAVVLGGWVGSLSIAIRGDSGVGPSLWVPALLSTTLFGALLSQGPWGSSYALTPLLIIMAAASTSYALSRGAKIAGKLMIGSLVIVSLWVPFYGMSGDRLRFVDAFQPQTLGGSESATRFIPMTGIQHLAMDELRSSLRSGSGTLAEFPMEDPLPYLDSEYIPWWRCSQGNENTCPSITEVKQAFLTEPPDVLIIKENTQLTQSPEPDVLKLVQAVRACFTPTWTVNGHYSAYYDLRPNPCLEAELGSFATSEF